MPHSMTKAAFYSVTFEEMVEEMDRNELKAYIRAGIAASLDSVCDLEYTNRLKKQFGNATGYCELLELAYELFDNVN